MVEKVVVAASTGWRRVPAWRRLAGLLVDGPREPLGFLPTLFRAYIAAGPLRMLRTMQASRPEALVPRLGGITAPTLVVWGARDPVITLDEARRMAQAIPRGRLAIIEEGAHGVIFDAPARFNRLVCRFLGEPAPIEPAAL
jgi:pimeloyl-ACP methyl ester carboxylesterase